MRIRLFSTLLGILAVAITAAAAPGRVLARDSGAVIAMTGVIQPGAYEVFYTVVSRANPNLVVVSGPGGDLATALRIATEVRRRGFDTAVPPGEYCASACAVIFLSGRTKYIARGAKVGLHSASNLDGSFSREGTAIMGRFLAQVGVPSRVIARMEQRRGNEMYWLGSSDKQALDIVATGALPRSAAPKSAAAATARAPVARAADRGTASAKCGAGSSCYRMLPNGTILMVP